MGKTILRGFIGLAPIVICVVLIGWIVNQLDSIFGKPIVWIFGPKADFPGVGVIVGLVVLYIIGLILSHWMIQRLYNWLENIMKRIPLLKTIYTSVTDLMSFFNTGKGNSKDKVVTVDLNGMKMLGLVTRETFDDLPEGIGKEGDVAVFFPFSYQIGGLTVIVPKSSVKPVDFTIEKGLRFIVTAGSPGADKSTFDVKRADKKDSS